MSDPSTVRIPREHPTVERTARLWEEDGWFEQAARVRRMGICLNPVSADEETAKKHVHYARFWVAFKKAREQRDKRGMKPARIATLNKLCIEFDIVDVNGNPDTDFANRILRGGIPGVKPIKDRILEDERILEEEGNALAT